MALLKRHLTKALGLFALFTTSLTAILHGQAQSEKQVIFRMLAAGDDSALHGLLYDYKGKPVPLNATSSNLSSPLPSPPGGRLPIYRLTPSPTPGEPPVKTPVAEAMIGKDGPYLLLLAAGPNNLPPQERKIVPMVVDASLEAHPLNSIRLFNFSARKIAVQLGTETVELASGGTHLIAPPSGNPMVPFQIATSEAGSWNLRLSSQTPVIDSTRSIMVVTDIEPTPERPNPVDVLATTVFDDRPPPAKSVRISSN